VNRPIISQHVENQPPRNFFGDFCPSARLRIKLLYRWLPSILAIEVTLLLGKYTADVLACDQLEYLDGRKDLPIIHCEIEANAGILESMRVGAFSTNLGRTDKGDWYEKQDTEPDTERKR
jgi:hypothetical protein